MNITPEAIITLPVLLFSIICHEVGHAFAAHLGGDDTAKDQGRMSLNPIVHIDPIGTVLLPILGLLTNFPMIGWAKPVPVNPRNLRTPQWGLVVAVAGVSMNFALAIAALVVCRILLIFGFGSGATDTVTAGLILHALLNGAFINLLLMVFNLIPIPPLDGSHFLFYFARTRDSAWFKALEFFERFGFIILLILFYSGLFQAVVLPIVNGMFHVLGKIIVGE